MFGAVACIDAPQMNGDVATSSSSTDPSGGASAVSGARDGMVLVPAATLAVATGVTPNAVPPASKPGGDGNGADPKPPKGGDGKGDGNGGNGGADAGGGSGTRAPAPVAIPAFWLDSVEVTVAAYRACIAAGTCAAPTSAPGCTLAAGLETHPVNCVSLDQARAYCTWLGKRLVRNDEWSSATSGASARVYPWGADAPGPDRLNACGSECASSTGGAMYGASDGFAATAPVGSFPLGRTPDGALDLAGNVAEWVDGTPAPLARGGSYADVVASSIMSASVGVAASAGPTVGFRCAADN